MLRARAGIAELCAASLVCRSHLRHRAAIVADDSAGLAGALLALAEEGGTPLRRFARQRRDRRHAGRRPSSVVHLPEEDETVVNAVQALAASSAGLSAALARHPSEAGRTSDSAHDVRPLRAAITVAPRACCSKTFEPGATSQPGSRGPPTPRTAASSSVSPARSRRTALPARAGSPRVVLGKPWPALLRALAELHIHGITPEPGPLTAPFARPEALPTYPFQRQRHWLPTTHMLDTGTTSAPFDVLDGRLTTPGDGALELHYDLSHARLPELADNHGVFHIGQYVERVARAARRYIPLARIVLRDVHFEQALRLAAQQRTDVRLIVEDGAWRVLTGDGRRAHNAVTSRPFPPPIRSRSPAVFSGGTHGRTSESTRALGVAASSPRRERPQAAAGAIYP